MSKRISKNGPTNHPLEYKSYRTMLYRCLNPASNKFHLYGGAGIKVCRRWAEGHGDLAGFDAFLSDMGSRPSKDHWLDRENSFGDYEPKNCRWLHKRLQQLNKRSATKLKICGLERSVSDWARLCGVNSYVSLSQEVLECINASVRDHRDSNNDLLRALLAGLTGTALEPLCTLIETDLAGQRP